MKLTNFSYIFLLLFFFIGLSVKLYFDKKNISQINTSNIKASNDSIKYYKNKFGNEVASKLAFQYDLSQLKNVASENVKLKEVIKKFKKPITIIETVQVVKIDTMYIPFENKIDCVFNEDIIKGTEYYSFSANVSEIGFKLNYLKLFNNQTIITGLKRQGLFKRPLLTTEITNTNPYIKQTKIKPIVIIYPQKIYEKWFITIPIGIVLGKLL